MTLAIWTIRSGLLLPTIIVKPPQRYPMQNNDTPEDIRNAHLNHETSLKSVGVLYYLGAVLLCFSTIGTFMDQSTTGGARIVIGLLLATFVVIYILVGRMFRALSPKAKTPGTLLSALGLLAFPIGTLINGYILYLIHSKKGKMVFSDEYKEVIAQTPNIKYKTPLLVWIFIALLILLIIVGIAAIVSQ